MKQLAVHAQYHRTTMYGLESYSKLGFVLLPVAGWRSCDEGPGRVYCGGHEADERD